MTTSCSSSRGHGSTWCHMRSDQGRVGSRGETVVVHNLCVLGAAQRLLSSLIHLNIPIFLPQQLGVTPNGCLN